MQKDYHIVISSEAGIAETEHIARHWTAVWDKLRASGWTPHAIRNDEKYRRMAPYLRKLPRSARVLDGGCGLGQWVLTLDDDGFETTGLDLSKETISFLAERFPGRRFAVGDIRELPFEDNSFDAYLSWGTFEHFEHGMEMPIAEACRILKPGGLLFITAPFQNLRHIIRGAPRMPPGSDARFYQWRFTRRELQQELTLRGFTVLSIIPVSKAEGASRMVEHDFHLSRKSFAGKVLTKLLLAFAPRAWVGHMLFAVAMKNTA